MRVGVPVRTCFPCIVVTVACVLACLRPEPCGQRVIAAISQRIIYAIKLLYFSWPVTHWPRTMPVITVCCMCWYHTRSACGSPWVQIQVASLLHKLSWVLFASTTFMSSDQCGCVRVGTCFPCIVVAVACVLACLRPGPSKD